MTYTKKFILGTVVSLGLAGTLLAEGTNQLTDEKSRVSYAIGMMLGHNWKQQGLEVDPDIAARAIKDIQSGGPTLLTQEEMQQTLTSFQKEFAAKQQKHAGRRSHQQQAGRRSLSGRQQKQSRRAVAARRPAIPRHHQRHRPAADARATPSR